MECRSTDPFTCWEESCAPSRRQSVLRSCSPGTRIQYTSTSPLMKRSFSDRPSTSFLLMLRSNISQTGHVSADFAREIRLWCEFSNVAIRFAFLLYQFLKTLWHSSHTWREWNHAAYSFSFCSRSKGWSVELDSKMSGWSWRGWAASVEVVIFKRVLGNEVPDCLSFVGK